MRDEEKIDPFLSALRDFWLKNPDWRFGQLVVNVLRHGTDSRGKTPINDPFYVEDERFLERLRTLDEQMCYPC